SRKTTGGKLSWIADCEFPKNAFQSEIRNPKSYRRPLLCTTRRFRDNIRQSQRTVRSMTMNGSTPFQTRRLFLRGMTFGAAALGAPGLFSRLFAEELTLTPRQTEGPFYPDHLPLDTDNDLIIVNDGITPAVGEITHLSGRILDAKGEPIRNALVEIWQVDNHGVYLHSRDTHPERDENFPGFG